VSAVSILFLLSSNPGGNMQQVKSARTTVKVWDRFVRVFHWSLVISFFTAYFFTTSIGWMHKGFGYATLALITARIVWGFVGKGHATFADFVPSPRTLLGYVQSMLRFKQPRYLGHNPAAAVMILFLLSMVAGIGITGWMMTLDAFWGNATVENAHIWMVNSVLVAVAIHVSAAIYESLHHRENLILSMFTGHKTVQTSPQTPPQN
jgi:cytochrome b